MSAICLLVLTYLIWIPESKFIVSNIPSRCNSVGSGNVSHSWTASFDDHVDHRIVVFRNETRCSMAGDVNVLKNKTYAVRVKAATHIDYRVPQIECKNSFQSSTSVY